MHDTRSARQQKGATLVFVALWMGIALAGLMVLDIGNLFWQKRELQKIADLSALAGASGDLEQCEVNALAVAGANGLVGNDPEPKTHAGTWGGKTDFDAFASTPLGNACGVQVSRLVPYFFIWPAQAGSARLITAEAIAVAKSRLARLSIRSALLKLDTAESPLLNPLMSGLLGGQLNLDVATWEGLIGADLELLNFLNLLSTKVGLNIGNYDELLTSNISVGILLEVMIEALEKNDATADVAIQALNAIIKAGANVKRLTVKLGEILKIQSGTPESGLMTNINPLGLVQATLQLANSNHATQLDLDTAGMGMDNLVNLAVRLRIVEPPKISAIGDPHLAKDEPLGPNSIFVRTAQIRLLISLDIPVLTGLVNGVLNIVGALIDLTINVVPNARLDLFLEAGGGAVYVTDYSCTNGSKELQTTLRTSVSDLYIGKMGDTAAEASENVLGSKASIINKPIPLITLGCRYCLLQGGGPKLQAYGGLGLQLDSPIGEYDVSSFTFKNPPKLCEDNPVTGLCESTEPLWKGQPTQDVIGSLKGILNGVGGLVVSLPADSPNLISGLLGVVAALTQGLGVIVSGLLSPLLDPIINELLKLLGIDLATTEAGAQLNCGGGSELVY